MIFYLGTHATGWLQTAGFPLFISRRRLARIKTWPRAIAPWALDGGGYTILNQTGAWDITAEQYIAIVRRARDEIGLLDWAAPMDWMCEPAVRRRTGLTVAQHQRLTVDNYLRLRDLDPLLPIRRVLQGWDGPDDYLRCRDLYAKAGISLDDGQLTGLGSVCRRQGTPAIRAIVSRLSMEGIRMHGFGVKTRGLAKYGPDLASADSMAWSFRGRKLPGCGIGRHKSEANCFAFACAWRGETLIALDGAPPSLWSPVEEAA